MSEAHSQEPSPTPPSVDSDLRADYRDEPPIPSDHWTDLVQMAYRFVVIFFSVVVVVVVLGLIFPPFAKVRDAANRSVMSNKLKMVGVAFHNYESNYGVLVTNRHSPKDCRVLASWRVELMPFLDSGLPDLPEDTEASWDSLAFANITNTPLREYQTVGTKPSNVTQIQAFTGPKAALETVFGIDPITGKTIVLRKSLQMGTTDTVFACEAMNPVIYSQPSDLNFPNPTMPALGLNRKSKDVQFLMFDGSTRKIRHPEISPEVLTKMVQMTVGGKE